MAIRPELIMTSPAAFEVSYVINPWMQPDRWRQSTQLLQAKARAGWNQLKNALESHGVGIHLIDPVEGMPDLVFPANAAVVLNGKVLLGHFAHSERQKEEPVFRAFFEKLQRRGIINSISSMPNSIFQEGAGDCLWDARRKMFWAGHGQRSEKPAVGEIARYYNCEAVALELVDPRFYHLDVALAALENGEIIYYPNAFSKSSQDKLRQCIPGPERIEVAESDATRFNLNIVSANKHLFMTPPDPKLRDQLQERGYRLCTIDLSPFMLAGGAAACLTLRLDFRHGSHWQMSQRESAHA